MNHVQSPDTSDSAIEREIKQKGLTAPRVTPADIEANIGSEHYFTANEGVLGERSCVAPGSSANPLDRGTPAALGLLTFCVLVLRNGFTVTGESACASPENFNAELGRKIARANAVNKIWPLMGYALKERLAAVPASHQDRVRVELAELTEKKDKLQAFFGTAVFAQLPIDEQDMLELQHGQMQAYAHTLARRIARF
jgi:Phage protein (N4 Gp49/phage Sf6 gene 66) family